MTDERLDKMKTTGSVVLSNWQLFSHYFILGFFLVFPVIGGYFLVKDYIGVSNTVHISNNWLVALSLIPIVPGIVLFFIQKRRLRFRIIEGPCGSDQFVKAAHATAHQLNWDIVEEGKDFFIAKSGFSWRSWGEHITIVRDNDRVLFNSICDPDNKTSIATWGRNASNFTTFELNLLVANTEAASANS